MKDTLIGVTSESFSFHESLKGELLEAFPKSKLRRDRNKLSRKDLIGFLKDCEGAIVGLDAIDKEVLDQCPNIRIIAKYGVGLNNLDLNSLEKRNVALGWTPGVNKNAVSELTLAQMINLSRNISLTSNLLRQQKWVKNGGRELSELKIGVVGVGHIGQEVIRKLQVFAPVILACDILDKTTFLKPLGVPQVSHQEIYSQCDLISLHVPLDETTFNMIKKETLQQMKPGTILINTARGGIINEEDLYEALKANQIYAAAMDVFEDEPAIHHKLHSLPNFFPTPHISGNSNQAILDMGRSAIEHLKNHFGNNL